MIALRLAAGIAAACTIILNAHAGFISSKELEYAVLFATLYAALDIGKCALLVAASQASQQRAYVVVLLCTALFVPLFVNSVWNAVSQVALTRDQGKADKTAALQLRTRTDADYRRLTDELALLQTNPLYAATSACALPKNRDARAFCDKVQATSDALAAASTSLTSSSPTDPEPHITLMAALLGMTAQPIQFTAALLPVLLAEVLGSFGFYIASRIRTEASQKPVDSVSKSWLARWRPIRKTAPVAPPEASAAVPAPVPQALRPGPVWSTAVRVSSAAGANP